MDGNGGPKLPEHRRRQLREAQRRWRQKQKDARPADGAAERIRGLEAELEAARREIERLRAGGFWGRLVRWAKIG